MEYGLGYDSDMQLLVWEFLSKLEKLLPVPDLGQVGQDISDYYYYSFIADRFAFVSKSRPFPG